MPFTAASRRSCCSPRTRATASACGVGRTRTLTSRTPFIVLLSTARTRRSIRTWRGPNSPHGTTSRCRRPARAGRPGIVRGRRAPPVRPRRGQPCRPPVGSGRLLRRPAPRSEPGGPPDHAPGPGRDDLVQAVLSLRRRTMAQRRSGFRRRRAACSAAIGNGSTSRPPTSSRCRTAGSTRGSPPGIWRFTAPPWPSSMWISPRTRSS